MDRAHAQIPHQTADVLSIQVREVRQVVRDGEAREIREGQMSDKLSKTGYEMLLAVWGAGAFAVMFTLGQLYLHETQCRWIEATGAFKGEPLQLNMELVTAITPGGTANGRPAQALVWHGGQSIGVLETPDELMRLCKGEDVVTRHKFVEPPKSTKFDDNGQPIKPQHSH
jgi:hypothetical protein